EVCEMKRKWIALILAGCLGLGMTACGGNSEDTQTEPGTESADGASEDEEEDAAKEFDAKTFVDTLLNGDAASLETEYALTDEMNTALAAQGGLAGLQTQLKTLGAVKSMEDPSVT